MTLGKEHFAISFVDLPYIENNKKIDRAEFVIDHRRPAHLCADSQIHFEKARQIGRLGIRFILAKANAILSRDDSQRIMKMTVFKQLFIRFFTHTRICRKDRTASEEIALAGA